MNPSYLPGESLPPLSHYPLVPTQTSRGITYVFTTQKGKRVELAFESEEDYLPDQPFSDSVYSIAIKVSDKGLKDRFVKQTIVYALREAFNANLIITFICSVQDDQQRIRRLLFGFWYQEYGLDYKRLQHTNPNKIYSAAIFVRNHPHRLLIERSFEGIYKDK